MVACELVGVVVGVWYVRELVGVWYVCGTCMSGCVSGVLVGVLVVC